MSGVVLVTGATGFLGGALLRALRRQDQASIGIGRDPTACTALRAEGFTVVQHDLAKPFSAQQSLTLGAVKAVVHAAARSSPFGSDAAFEIANVLGTQHVLDLAHNLGAARFVYISSASVCFAPKDQIGLRESDPLPRPFNAYARTKAKGEQLALGAGDLAPIVLRPRGIYGSGDTALLPRLLRAARRGPLPLLRGGLAQIDLTHIDDVVAAIMAALQSTNAGQIFNISSGEALPVTQIATKACARVGLVARWRRMPLWPLMASAGVVEIANRWAHCATEPAISRYGLALFAYAQSLDLTKARTQLGWTPQICFEDGLARSFPKGWQE